MNRAIFLIHRTLPGRRDDVQAEWDRHLRPAVEANPDHLAYWYCFDPVDVDVIRVFQLYTNAEAAAAFLATDAYDDYLAAVEPLLDGPPEVHPADARWAK